MRRFEEKVCIVTGGANGIGRACAERFAAEGARVAVFDLPNQIDAADFGDSGIVGVACDVSSRAEVEAAFADTLTRLGPVDVLVANAGRVLEADFLEMTDDQFDRTVDVNLTGTFITSQVAARQMVAAGLAGSIITMASVGAYLGNPQHVAYSATKGGIISFTKAIAVALAAHGIRANAVAPATIGTVMTQHVADDPEQMASIRARTPLGRLGTVDEVAGAVAYLASSDASFTTGHVLFVDGGRTSLNYSLRTA